MDFLAYIKSIIPVSDSLQGQLKIACEKTRFKKGDKLLTTKMRCTNLYYIEKGLVRGYYFSEEKEITNWFAQEGEFATCFYSFIAQKQSFENIEVVEDVELIQISFTSLQHLYNKFPETERVGRLLTETYYIKLEERLLSMQFKTAKERYKNLLDTRASLIQRAALGQIATYLGISQETLSRIRAEL